MFYIKCESQKDAQQILAAAARTANIGVHYGLEDTRERSLYAYNDDTLNSIDDGGGSEIDISEKDERFAPIFYVE